MFLSKTVDKKHDLRIFCRWSNLSRFTRFWGDQSGHKFAVGGPQLILRAVEQTQGIHSIFNLNLFDWNCIHFSCRDNPSLQTQYHVSVVPCICCTMYLLCHGNVFIYHTFYMSSSVRISVKHKQGMRGKSAILIFDILRPANSVPRKTSQPSSSSWAQR